MRNTGQYPITADECAQTIQRLRTRHLDTSASIMFGDIGPYALSLLLEYIEENKEGIDEFLAKRCTE